MKYITVLDFEVGRVFQYKIESNDFGPHLLEYYEEYLTNKGHNLTNCEWMEHEEPRVIDKNHEAYR